MEEAVVFWLPWPPTVNSYWKPIRNSLYLSKAGREYKERVCDAIAEQLPDIKLDGRLLLEVYLFPPDKRARDIDNYSKGLLDAITASGLWNDDSQVDQLFTYRGVPGSGRVRIEVHPAGPLIPEMP